MKNPYYPFIGIHIVYLILWMPTMLLENSSTSCAVVQDLVITGYFLLAYMAWSVFMIGSLSLKMAPIKEMIIAILLLFFTFFSYEAICFFAFSFLGCN